MLILSASDRLQKLARPAATMDLHRSLLSGCLVSALVTVVRILNHGQELRPPSVVSVTMETPLPCLVTHPFSLPVDNGLCSVCYMVNVKTVLIGSEAPVSSQLICAQISLLHNTAQQELHSYVLPSGHL